MLCVAVLSEMHLAHALLCCTNESLVERFISVHDCGHLAVFPLNFQDLLSIAVTTDFSMTSTGIQKDWFSSASGKCMRRIRFLDSCQK